MLDQHCYPSKPVQVYFTILFVNHKSSYSGSALMKENHHIHL